MMLVFAAGQSMGLPNNPTTVRRWNIWLASSAFLTAAASAAWFIDRNVFQYLTLDAEKYTSYYWPRRLGLLLHVTCGSTALTIGLVQLWFVSRGFNPRIHRKLGQAYMLCVAVGGLAALYLAATIPPPIGWYAWGLSGLEVAWIVTTALGYVAIRQGTVSRHRAWMIRSYTVTFSFVILRLFMNAMKALGIGTEDELFDAAAWVSWVVPLALVQIYLVRRGALRFYEGQ